eukprot:CCRYP_018442-RA/>CCRYP_018442-RA protein AED:0.53 eAED:0.56 QI:0/0/0/1/0/0/2/0/157
MSCNILGNAYLYAPFREKIWFRAGIEYGDHKGKAMIVTRALYGLKSSGGGASWRAMFAESLRQMGWESTTVDSDVYQRKCHKGAGTPYYELLLVYADNCMAVSNDPKAIMESISSEYELKDGTYGWMRVENRKEGSQSLLPPRYTPELQTGYSNINN